MADEVLIVFFDGDFDSEEVMTASDASSFCSTVVIGDLGKIFVESWEMAEAIACKRSVG